MAITSDLPIYKVAYDLMKQLAIRLGCQTTPAKSLVMFDAIVGCHWQGSMVASLTSANSYFGLLRQASHSHHDRTSLANVLRYRGHCINKELTKTFRRAA